MQTKVTRRTGLFGMAVKLTVIMDEEESVQLAVNESHTISKEKSSVKIRAKQMMTGSNTVEAQDGDNIVIKYNYVTIFPLLISIFLVFLSNVLFESGMVKVAFLALALLGITISMVVSWKAGLIVRKDNSTSN